MTDQRGRTKTFDKIRRIITAIEFNNHGAETEASLISDVIDLLHTTKKTAPPSKNSPTSPSYYDRYAIKPIDFMVDNNIPFAEGNIVKYVIRWKEKNGVEDLNKAKVYLDKLIKVASQPSDKKDNIYDTHVAI